MATVAESMDQIIYVGIGIFVLILILSLNYQGYAVSSNQIVLRYGQVSATNASTASGSALYIKAANTLSVTFTGAYTWIGATTPVTLTLTGNLVNAYATNAAAANSIGLETQVFTINSPTATQTLGVNAGNFYNLQTITLSGVYGAASPSITATVTESYNQIVTGSNTVTTNTIVGSDIVSVSLGSQPGVVSNYTLYAGPLPNTFAGALQLAVFALVFIAIILAIIGALRGGQVAGTSGGFLS